MSGNKIVLGADIGGTFTDVVLYVNGEYQFVKTPSTEDLISGVTTGIREACDATDVTPDAIDRLIHGHTVVLNTLLERNGADIALVTTRGFRDIIEIREGARRADLLYDYFGRRPDPLVARKDRFDVDERIDHTGSIVEDLAIEDVDDLLNTIHDGYDGIAVSLLHAHKNPQHERAIEGLVEEDYPELDISISSTVSPEIREYSRTATTAVDAYVKPRIKAYLEELTRTLDALDVTDEIYIMQSDGGVTDVDLAANQPVKQLISGPVAGVKGSQYVSEQINEQDIITFDMGGTSTDTALITDGEPVQQPKTEIADLKINGPFVDINTIGAGGGSIARATREGELTIGPESAGSEPGPVCYGKGGERPTVTDADLVIGLLNPTNFAGGEFDLDTAAAAEAIRTHVADPLDIGIVEAATAIREIVNTKMASTIRLTAIEQGKDPRTFTLLGYGGAGPVHACEIAAELDIDTVVIPKNPGLFSSYGMLTTHEKQHFVRSIIERLETESVDSLNRQISAVIDDGLDAIGIDHGEAADTELRLSFDLMYAGQSHYLNVPLEASNPIERTFAFSEPHIAGLRTAFEDTHDALYGFTDAGSAIEVVNVRIEVVRKADMPDARSPAETSTASSAQPEGYREVQLAGRSVDVPYFEWESLHKGVHVDGPAIVETDNSTVWILPDYTGVIDPFDNIRLTRGEHQ